MTRPLPATDSRRGPRDRGECPVCGLDVALTPDGIPYRHPRGGAGGYCLGDRCVGKHAMLTLDQARFLRTDDAWYRLEILGDVIEGHGSLDDLKT